MHSNTKTKLTDNVPGIPGRKTLSVDASSATPSRHRYGRRCWQFQLAMACTKKTVPAARIAPR